MLSAPAHQSIAGQSGVNVGDSGYNPLFAYGYGMDYSDKTPVPQLSEDPELTQGSRH